MTLKAWNKMYLPYVGRPAFVLRVSVARPRSRGWIQLRSTDPFDSPVIQPNFLSAKEDVIIAIDGLRWHYRTAQTQVFKLAQAIMFETLVSGCEHLYKLVDDYLFPGFVVPVDEYLECQARSMVVSGFHQTSTCRMGPESDPMAVVDSQLRVYGVSGLRVIDASIMPVITNSNTNAPTIMIIMIAERGAQFIIDKYGLYGALVSY
jgi:choline dehydrogenase